ncbi:MAG: ABC transporter permease [Anaerolineaceae bacterium]|nr:ABC transporter permease [Anaerolineaceae bacterium]
MRAFLKLTFVQVKLYLRDPMGVFFTLLFGPLMMVLLGMVFGNQPDPMFGGLGYMDISIPAYIGVIIAITGLTTIPITSATRRESGVIRRFSATPLRPLTYFLSDIFSPFLMTLIGILLLFLTGKIMFQVQFEGQFLQILIAICLGMLAFFTLGYVLANLLPSAQAAIVTGNIVLIPMMFLSGAYMPIQVMPQGVQDIAQFLPLTHLIALLRGLWFSPGLFAYSTQILVLGGILLIGSLIVVLTFRWE